jgi:class 3 adenylate cyclase/predicted esterase
VDRPEPRYARSGDLSIAYLTAGDGPLDIVYVPGFISHADLLWDIPLFRQIATRLASFGRVITFDKRGTGLSDRTVGVGSTADRMDDIRAVMDAAGSERAALVGVSEGGPLCVLFAATYPDRVSSLVLWGTFAALLQRRDLPDGVPSDIVDGFLGRVEHVWGDGRILRTFVAGMPDDPAMVSTVARYERACATPGLVRDILDLNARIDVRAALSAVGAPTLVVHRTGDPIVPCRLGRTLADQIRRATFLELPGEFHLNGAIGGEDVALDAIEEFLTGRRSGHEIDRVLKTVLYTDVVDSTRRAAEMGDRQWRELLDRHDRIRDGEIHRAKGTTVKSLGDGFLAAFDGPARAIKCAQAVVERVHAIGLPLRAGLHAGECEVRDDDLAGMTLHVGARVASLAGSGEILVTGTVRDLVLGGDFEFEDRGRHALKGVPGEWPVLAVLR